VRALFYHPGGRWDGGARAFAAAARGLAARGWQVGVATAPESPAAARAARGGVAVAPLDAAESFVGAVGALTRAMRAHRAEVVFVHGERGQTVGAGAAWRAGGAVVVRRVPAGAAGALDSAAVGAALRTAPTGFLCTWPEHVEAVPARVRPSAVVADLGVAPPAAGAGGDGFGAAPGAAPARASGPRRVVCAYEPSAHLRAATVLRAAALLAPRHPDLRVVFAGPGASDEGLRLHAAALGIHRLLRAHDPSRAPAGGDGARPDGARDADDDGASADGAGDPAHADLAGAAVAWVLADGDDGAFGALDAMAAGVPVLAERGGTAARYVADAITGLHLAPADVPGTAAVLAQLLAGDDARRAMGQAGRARVARTYTEAAMVDGFARAAAAAAAGVRAAAGARARAR
jgi:hypothetical protein